MKRIIAILLVLVMIVTAVPYYPIAKVNAAESTNTAGQTVLFEDDFNQGYSEKDYTEWLAKEIFGEAGYKLDQGFGDSATLSIENGGLRIQAADGEMAQFLVASNSAIAEKGVVIELDYTLNTGSNGYFAFASKPLQGATSVEKDAWISGIWPGTSSNYRACIRCSTTGNAWVKPGVAVNGTTYSTANNTTYNLKVEVTPTEGIKLSAKTTDAETYEVLANLTTDAMAEYPTVNFADYRDGNVRLLVKDKCDVTIDNLKVSLNTTSEEDAVVYINNDFASYPKYNEWLAKAVFGEANFKLDQGLNTGSAALSVVDGALRIEAADGEMAQFLVASDSAIAERGAVIELDYTLNSGSNGYFAFASKPLVLTASGVETEAWISGIWPGSSSNYRACLRGSANGNAWVKPGVAENGTKYSTADDTTYNLKIEVTPSEGIFLSAKTTDAETYEVLAHLSPEAMAEYPTVSFADYRDGNVRLLIKDKCDVTIDNMKVSLAKAPQPEQPELPEGTYFDNNFDDDSLKNLSSEELANAVFGEGNYNLTQGFGTNATLSIANGGLRIQSGSGDTAQFLLASNPAIAEKGAVIECDYTINTDFPNNDKYFTFASKPLQGKTSIMNEIWFSGIWFGRTDLYRAGFRTAATGNAWNKPGIANEGSTYCTANTTYNMKIEVTAADGIKLSAKAANAETYEVLAHLTTEEMAKYPDAKFADFNDGNIRLVTYDGIDITLDNLKVSLPKAEEPELPEGTYFDNNFDNENLKNLSSEELANAVFGEGNYNLTQGFNTYATLSIVNGGLRIQSGSGDTAQFLLASNPAIAEKGAVIECDYTINTDFPNNDKYFTFASKPLQGKTTIMNEIWFSGIWFGRTDLYRAGFRTASTGNAWNKPGIANEGSTYCTANTTYNMKIEVTATDGIKLSAKAANAETYEVLAHLTTEEMAKYPDAKFADFNDGNIRLVTYDGIDITLDNLKVSLPKAEEPEQPEQPERPELPEGTYFDDNFDAENLAGLSNEALAKAVFGDGNYLLNQGLNTGSATLSIENGGLKIKAADGEAAQFLVASDSAIAEKGAVIELDYTLNTGSNGYFAFASKPLVTKGGIDSNKVWISGIWPNGYRTSLRNGSPWVEPGIANTTDSSYAVAGTTFNLKVVVTPEVGVELSAKKATDTAYNTLLTLTPEAMDQYPNVTFEECRDGNIRLIIKDKCDVTIDNLKVTVPGTEDVEEPKPELPEGVYFDNNFDAAEIAQLTGDDLAKEVFGRGNYLLDQGLGSRATLSIVNGALRIKAADGEAAQFLLASDEAIAEHGTEIELDYTVNAGSNGYFAFASKPLERTGRIDSNDVWISGIWPNGYRAALRGTANNYVWEEPGIANTKDTTYSTAGITYNLKIRVTAKDGIELSIKKPGESAYKILANLTPEEMALYPDVKFVDYRDGNVRLILKDKCDVTIDNLKVSLAKEGEEYIPNKNLPEGVYFDENFDAAELAKLADDYLAKAVFGRGNYLLGKNGYNATLSIENNALRIKASNSAAAQFILANDEAIAERGAVIECDYYINTGSKGQFAFASKPLERGNLVDSNDVWISGIWPNGYRSSLRGKGNNYQWEEPGVASTKDPTYSAEGTAYKLRIEVTTNGGIKLSVKKAGENDYRYIASLSTDAMDFVPGISFADYRDGNVRLIVAANCDVTIDNLKVVLGPEAKTVEIPARKETAEGVFFDNDFNDPALTSLTDSDLAKAIFGKGNYVFGQGGTKATMSIENGALRIIGDDNGTPTDGTLPLNRTQFLLASDEAVKEGVVIECDYTFNTIVDGTSTGFTFASKPVVTRNAEKNVWIAGPYANSKARTAVRYEPKFEWKPLVYGGNIEASGLIGVTYQLRLEVSPKGGLALYAKREGTDDFLRLGKWSKEDIASFNGEFKDCYDENIRLIVQCWTDVTIDNLKVTSMKKATAMKVTNKDLYFFNDFNDANLAKLKDGDLAKALFGEYNYLLGHGKQDASIYVENGALRLVGDDNTEPEDGTASINRSQFLLASHPNIAKEGVIIECDYVFNKGASKAFTFASKGLVTSTDPKKTPSGIEANVWIAGPWAGDKSRTAVRFLPKQEWKPLAYGPSADASGEIGVRYHLKLEVSPTEGLALYVKTSMKGQYKRLGTWSESDIAAFKGDMIECLDENVRLLLQCNCDVTIDNLAVYAPGTNYEAKEETVIVKVNGEDMELPLGETDVSTFAEGDFLFAVVNGKIVLDPKVSIDYSIKTIDVYTLSLDTLDGAAVRTNKNTALRWQTTVRQDEYNSLTKAVKDRVIKNVEFGTLVMKTTELGNSGILDLTQEKNGAVKDVFDGKWIDNDFYEDMYLYGGVSEDISKEDYNVRYCGVGYATVTLPNGKKLNVYGGYDRFVHSRSVSEVAKTASQDENNGLTRRQERTIQPFAKAYKGKEAIEGAIVDVVLAENGKTQYTIAVGKGATDVEKKFANQIRTKVATETGVALKITSDTRYKEDSYEIVVGNTAYPESTQMINNLDVNEYSVRVVGNKIIIGGLTPSTMEAAMDLFDSIIGQDDNTKNSKATKSLTVSFADETRKEMSNWLANIPEFTGGRYESVYECGDDNIQFYYSHVKAEKIDAYVEKLNELGFETKQNNAIGNNRYVTCVGENGMVHLTYLDYFETMSVVTDPLVDTIYKETEPEYKKITDTTLAVMSLDYSHRVETDGNGEGYVITLEDGRYVIVDGGYTNDADGLYNFLVDNNKRSDGKIVVAAWILTHSHADHYGAFGEFSGKYGSKITLEYIIASPGSEHMYTSGGYDSWLTKNIPSALKQYNAQYIRPHAGQILKFCNVEFQILYTGENYAPNLITSENNASIVFRMTAEGQTVLFNNDAEYRVSVLLGEAYGDSLKSDIMQVNHHGRSGGFDAYFSLVHPQYTLWTTNQTTFELRTAEEANSSTDNAVTHAGNRYVYELVGRENCFVADGDVEIIKFPLQDNSKDITYYTPNHKERK